MRESSFRTKFNESQRLYKFQRDLETGATKIRDIRNEDKENLIKLYEQQIRDLKQSIENRTKRIEDYRNKIIEKRKLLK